MIFDCASFEYDHARANVLYENDAHVSILKDAEIFKAPEIEQAYFGRGTWKAGTMHYGLNCGETILRDLTYKTVA